MKKFIVVICAGMALFLSSCHEEIENTVKETGFNIETELVEAPAEGGEMTVAWSVENPIEGENVEIVPDYPDWIGEFDSSEEGIIGFNVEPNEENNSREAVIVVNYGEDSSSFKIVQEGMEEEPETGEIQLEIIESRPNTIIVSIETQDDITYFINIEEKAVWDTYSDKEEIFAKDMALFQWFADMWDMSLESWLREEFGTIKYVTPYHMFMYVQDEARGTVYLSNNTEYVIYAYGINGNGEILTDLYSVEASTTDYNLSNTVTFDIDVNITAENVGTFTITPSDNSQQYYGGVLLYKDELPDLEDLKYDILRKKEDLMFMYWSHPENFDSWEDIVSWMSFTGTQSIEDQLGIADAPGVVYAYTIDDRGLMNGEMVLEQFRTSDIEESGNKITMELSALTSRTATLSISTTNNDLYLVMFSENKEEYKDLEGEDFINAYLYDSDSKNVFSGRNNTVVTLKNMHRGVDYILVAFGYEAGQITTKPFVLEFSTPVPVVSDVTCEPYIAGYYDLQEAYDKYPDVFTDPYGESRPVALLKTELGGNPESFSYFLEFTETVQTLHEDDLITMLENHYNDLGPFSTEEWIYPFYGYSYTLVGVARDSDGNYGEVYLSEPFTFTEDGCSPIDGLVIE